MKKSLAIGIVIIGLSLLWIPFTRGSVHAQMDTDTVKGKWHPTANMTSARVDHTATLLKNGDVLVEGDANNFGSVPPAAELYHPKTATWSLTGQMQGFHVSDHVTVLLGDGTVLVTGGMGFSGLDTTALSELFHPTTGTWSVTGNLITSRTLFTATLLQNGEVLVVGGMRWINGNTTPLASAELYNPITGTWSPTGSLHTSHRGHTATLLPNGFVLVAGGIDDTGGTSSSAELYNPATGMWSLTGNMHAYRLGHTATLLNNGEVLVTGGETSVYPAIASAEIYNPTTGLWTLTGTMNAARVHQTATLLRNGKVLVVGGYDINASAMASAEIYNPSTGVWTQTGSMSTPRFFHTATLLHNGRVLAAGGNSLNGTSTSTAEVFAL